MPFSITVKTSFCAAMKLALPGPCSNIHGHTYKICASFQSNKLNKFGVVIDYYELEGAVNNVVKQIDHIYLNEHAWFQDLAPSSENIALVIYNKLKLINYEDIAIKQVTVSECENIVVSYAE